MFRNLPAVNARGDRGVHDKALVHRTRSKTAVRTRNLQRAKAYKWLQDHGHHDVAVILGLIPDSPP